MTETKRAATRRFETQNARVQLGATSPVKNQIYCRTETRRKLKLKDSRSGASFGTSAIFTLVCAAKSLPLLRFRSGRFGSAAQFF